MSCLPIDIPRMGVIIARHITVSERWNRARAIVRSSNDKSRERFVMRVTVLTVLTGIARSRILIWHTADRPPGTREREARDTHRTRIRLVGGGCEYPQYDNSIDLITTVFRDDERNPNSQRASNAYSARTGPCGTVGQCINKLPYTLGDPESIPFIPICRLGSVYKTDRRRTHTHRTDGTRH